MKNNVAGKRKTYQNNMLNARIKKIMDDIIEVAFPEKNANERDRYKNFKLDILVKENASNSGMYRGATHSIEVYNPSLGAKHLAKCCIHELSHHIDLCQHGKTGHQKPFYGVYAKLIYASLDMGILEKKDFDDHWSSDQNKVRAIVEKYVPHPVDYKPDDDQMIRILDGFKLKEQLKQNGYRWNGIEQVWEKMLRGKADIEEQILKDLGILKQPNKYVILPGPYYTIINPEMYIDAIVYIVAEGNTYDRRDRLKEYHFYFSKKEKMWLCKVKSSELKNMIKSLETDAELSGVKFAVHKRKNK